MHGGDNVSVVNRHGEKVELPRLHAQDHAAEALREWAGSSPRRLKIASALLMHRDDFPNERIAAAVGRSVRQTERYLAEGKEVMRELLGDRVRAA